MDANNTRDTKDKHDFKVTTMTICSDFLNEKIDLFNISKYIPIDQDILGIKYDFGGKCMVRGGYGTSKMTKSNFYNQVSLMMRNCSTKGGVLNVKLFGNGAVQMTGCKSTENALVAMSKLRQSLVNICKETEEIMLSKDDNGIYIDKDNFVYSTKYKRVIGYKTDVYMIGNKAYTIDEKTGMFISCKKNHGVAEIVDFDGVVVGTKRLKISKGVKRIYKNNVSTRTIDDVVFFSNENVTIVLGHYVYKMKNDKWKNDTQVQKSLDEVLLHEYTKSPFYGVAPEQQEKFDVQIHCGNVTFDLKRTIDRQFLTEEFLKRKYICKFNPQIYAGVKLTFKIPVDSKTLDGLCKCNNKCTCGKVTFLIFHSGKVIATGFKDEAQMAPVIASFKGICNSITCKDTPN